MSLRNSNLSSLRSSQGETFGYEGLEEENARVAAIVESLEKECAAFGGGTVGEKRRLEEEEEREELCRNLSSIEETLKASDFPNLPPSIVEAKITAIKEIAATSASLLNETGGSRTFKSTGRKRPLARGPKSKFYDKGGLREETVVDGKVVRKKVRVVRGMEGVVGKMCN